MRARSFQAFTVVMKFIPLKFILTACASFALAAQLAAEETNSASAPPDTGVVTQSMANGYLQIQAQLHDAQLAIENNRREMTAETQRNADALNARIQTLESTLATQQASAVESAQKNQRFTVMMAGVFGLIVVVAVLFMAYLQWRAVARVVELCAGRAPEFSLGNTPGATAFVANAAVAQSNTRLFNTVDALQQRILELEHSSRAPLAPASPVTATRSPQPPVSTGGSSVAADREECVANLLIEGQTLLDAHEPEKALECFDGALGLDPKHAEALVKKGGALEKLGKTEEAIACYDRAIEANSALTIAHLHKGGLFNRLARYDEALQCYEQALRTQEKKMPGSQVAA